MKKFLLEKLLESAGKELKLEKFNFIHLLLISFWREFVFRNSVYRKKKRPFAPISQNGN